MEPDKKPVCRYGAKCYRKNANHMKQYTHPSEISKDKKARPKTRPVVKKGVNTRRKQNLDDKSDEETEQVMEKESGLKGKRLSDSGDNNNVINNKRIKKDVSSGDSDSDTDVKSNSWTYIKAPAEEKCTSIENAMDGATKEEIIKYYYLVDMPPDFYSFYKFCKSVNENEALTVLQKFGLTLVGPFELLAGTKVNVDKDLMLCHWRYFYDPPEFQTVAASDTGFHIGYWRDSANELPVFVASNNPNEDCHFTVEGDNLFAAVNNYLTEFIKKCNPFKKTEAGKLQQNLQKWAENEKYSLEKSTPKTKERQKKVNSKTFHGAGIVVPVEKKTEVGYRPLCETDAKIKKICKLIIDADESERDALMEKLQPLITFANIANDECDFGNSLELGIDLFCMGSSIFDSTVEHLLTTAYSLLNRSEFGKIITEHLKNRRKDKNLSVL